MDELKPCPFCGGRARLENSRRAFINAKTSKVTFVYCLKCSARSGRYEIKDFGHSSKSAEACNRAIEAWNRRTSDG